MSIRDRFENSGTESSRLAGAEAMSDAARRNYREAKQRIHQTLLDRVDFGRLQELSAEQLGEELKVLIEQLMLESDVALNEQERRNLVRDLRWEMLGLGPLEPLLADPTISDILVNTYRQVYIERAGCLELTEVTFNDDEHLMKVIDKIVSRVGRRVDESSPMVDARLPDGSRVNAIIPPLAIDGPIMSIRRFGATPLRLHDLLNFKTMTAAMAETLQALSKAKVNLIISGGTGSGKTTLLNIMSGAIPASERIVTIEDAAELQLQQPHVVRLETRPPNIEGRGEVTQRALVRNALRMRPDRIILGEVRGAEAFDMLQAMNTGHEGSMVTIHANTPRDALSRLENMVGMAGMEMTPKVVRQQVASAISVIVQVSRLVDGKRKIISIQEITGMEGEMITMQEIFSFRQTGLSADRVVEGYFSASGVRPVFQERLKAFGIRLPDEYFDPTHHYS
ncbi:MAG TPA: CpaF family protein [Rhodocyclaceae bacterium]|nr:CpaF family protein [Rhodocyclaceae bacterium]